MDLATPQVHKSGNALHVTHGNDDGVFAEFYEEALPSTFESEKAGHPVFRNVIMVRMIFPGDKTKVVCKEVNDELKARFSRQWANFEKGVNGVGLIGMPLKEWSQMTKADVAMWSSQGIYTVEQLAGISDQNLPMGGRELRDRAIAYLKQAKDSSELMRVTGDNANLRNENDKLKSDVADLARRLEALESKKGKAA